MLVIFRLEGEGMIGERIFFDLLTVLRQLGVARDPKSIAVKLEIVLGHPLTLARALLRADHQSVRTTKSTLTTSRKSTWPR